MVEARVQITKKLNKVLTEEIEQLNGIEEEKKARKTEMFQELKIKVKPKMVIVNRELADLKNMFRDFSDKNQADGKPVFTKTLGFYLDGLKFDSGTVMGGLDAEIAAVKSELDQMKNANLVMIKSLMERVNFSEEQYNYMKEFQFQKEK